MLGRLFGLQENTNLIADEAGLQKYAAVVSAMKQWIQMQGDGWKTEIHKKGLRWTKSWDYDSDAAFAALAEYLATPPAIVPCRNATVWPPKN